MKRLFGAAVLAAAFFIHGCNTPTPKPLPTATPTFSPTPTVTVSPTQAPTETPPPWYSPPPTPTPTPTVVPSQNPTVVPTQIPVGTPTPWWSPEPTPTPTPVPTATPYNGPSVKGMSAYTFVHSMGVNTHLSYPQGQWQNESFIERMLTSIGFTHIRDGIDLSGNPEKVAFVDKLALDGIKSDLMVNNILVTPAKIEAQIDKFKAGDIDIIEATNELDGAGDPTWASDDINIMQSELYPIQQNPAYEYLKLLAPSIIIDPSPIGNQAPYIDYGNVHPYKEPRNPETQGWGGVYYGYSYGSDGYDLGKAAVISGTKPVIASEFGYNTLQGVNGHVSEYTQGVYLPREMIDQAQAGYYRQDLYDLTDEGPPAGNDGYWGLSRPDGTMKPAAYAVQGTLNILHDDNPTNGPCSAPIQIGTPVPNADIQTQVFCKSTGEYDIAIWNPDLLQNIADTTTVSYNSIPAATVSLTFFQQPTSVVKWTQDSTLKWSYDNNPDVNAIPFNERVLYIQVNGRQPGPMPALPTAPPIQLAN